MRNIKKYLVISSIDLILLIPLIFGVFIQYVIIREINLPILLGIVISLSLTLLLSKAIQEYGFKKSTLEMMKNHDVTATFLEMEHKSILFLFFPLTMLMEELIFRFYLIGIMVIVLNFEPIITILISSLIFSIYHLHFWFRFKNGRITIIYMFSSFVLGLFLSFTLMTLGLIFCIAFHFSLALLMYYGLAKKIRSGSQ